MAGAGVDGGGVIMVAFSPPAPRGTSSKPKYTRDNQRTLEQQLLIDWQMPRDFIILVVAYAEINITSDLSQWKALRFIDRKNIILGRSSFPVRTAAASIHPHQTQKNRGCRVVAILRILALPSWNYKVR